MEFSMEVFGGIFGIVAIFLIWLIPLVGILQSNRTEGVVKALWFLATLFISWFVWILYLLLVPKKQAVNL
jgi:uncharacterized protein with PQ loop repeat